MPRNMTEKRQYNGSTPPRDIDEAIHRCILALESDDESTIQELMTSCPQWKDELEEFLTNWGGMEQVAQQVASGSDMIAENQSGNQVGDYKLIEQIGSGGMGVIYKAHQLTLDRLVALKMINRDQTDRERFQVEAEAIAALTHSNIVQVYEIGEHDGRMFFSMQLIEGCNLKEYRTQKKVDPKEAASITKTVALAVHYAHQRGILHRDLKPANVLMDQDGQPHITDFGLAKQLGRDNDLTVSGAIIGTPAYMAPEQAAGQAKNLTVATDVYGLGAILYALITGQAPFTGESSLEIIRKVVEQPPSSPRIHNSDVGKDLETICLKCLEKSPELRYASAAELADDLELFLSGQPVNARPVPQLERIWRWSVRNPIVTFLTIAVVLSLISTAVTAVFLALSERNARITSERGEQEKKLLQDDIQQAQLKEESARRLADRNKTKLFLTNGQWNMLDGKLGESLLWYSHVAQRLRPDPVAYEANLIRCNSVLQNVAVPVHAMQLDSDYHDIPWGQQDAIELDSRGNRALVQVGLEFFVLNFSTDTVHLLNEWFPNITCAKFCASADQLVLGSQDNKFLFVDPDTLEVRKELGVGGPVSGLAVASNGKMVGATFDNLVAIWDADQEKFIEPRMQFDSAIEHLKFDRQAHRALVVYQDNAGENDKTGRLAAYTELIEIDSSGVNSIAKIPCRMMKRQHFRYPNRRPFWPLFVKQDQAIMLRREPTRIHFYDANNGERIRYRLSGAGDFHFSASRDGEYYATGKVGMASIRRVLFSPPDSESPLRAKEYMRLFHDGQVVEAIVSNNGLVASCNSDGILKLWQLHKSQFLRPCEDVPKVFDQRECLCEIPHQEIVRRMVFSDEGSQLMTVQSDGLVRVWSVPDYAQQIEEFEVDKGGALAKLVSDNEWIISGLSKWTGHVSNIDCFDLRSGERLGGTTFSKYREDGHILDSAVSPDLQMMVSIHGADARSETTMIQSDGSAGYLQFWSYPDGASLHERIPMPSEPRSVAFHPSKNQVAVATLKMEVLLFDCRTFQLLATLTPDDHEMQKLAKTDVMPMEKCNGIISFNPQGDQVMVWGRGDKLRVWNLTTRALQFPAFDNNTRKVEWAEYSEDGKTIAMALGRSGMVRTLNALTGASAGPALRHDSAVVSARFDRSGKRLITASQDGRARIFHWASGKQIELGVRGSSQLVDACITPDSEFAITLDSDQHVYIWNIESGELAMMPLLAAPGANQLLVSDDSRRLIVGGGLRRMMVIRLDQLYEQPGARTDELTWISEMVSGKRLSDKSTILLSSSKWLEAWQLRRGSNRVSKGVPEQK